MKDLFRSDAEMDILAVAGIICEHLTYGPLDPSAEEIEEWNDEGWGYEIRYDTEEYTDDRSYTRVEGRTLDPAELDAAVRLAREWAAGDYHHESRVPEAWS